MDKILQTAICAVATVVVVGIICATVYETSKPTQDEIRLRAIEIRRELMEQCESVSREIEYQKIMQRIHETDSILNAN